MGLTQETPRVIYMFDDFHADDEIESVWFKERDKLVRCIGQSNIKALASCQRDCRLGTLNSAKPPMATSSKLRQHRSVTAADIENRPIGGY
jgi:hypothetical protein